METSLRRTAMLFTEDDGSTNFISVENCVNILRIEEVAQKVEEASQQSRIPIDEIKRRLRTNCLFSWVKE